MFISSKKHYENIKCIIMWEIHVILLYTMWSFDNFDGNFWVIAFMLMVS